MRPTQEWTAKEQLINEIQIDRICGNVSDKTADEALAVVWFMYPEVSC